MTIDSISLNQAGAVGRSGAFADPPAALAGDTARNVAVSVVGRIASELALAPPRPGNVAENYGVRGLADAIGARFPDATPTQLGDLSRSLEDFAGAVATDMAAYADGATLDRVDAAIASFDPQGGQGLDAVTALLEKATEAVAAPR
ncbi:hypothetical protein AB2M62_14950 [Sphingomonas sp. MMS12-HWE2-04]|uniref:hypothetical protein n=1 Tax=Sphingomonas sp. MMS12-HWE2-04 TaxID=3234199 RepID=UPI00384E5243